MSGYERCIVFQKDSLNLACTQQCVHQNRKLSAEKAVGAQVCLVGAERLLQGGLA